MTTSTTGSSLDPDGYRLKVDGVDRGPIGINATKTLTGLPTGNHSVVLMGVAGNCTVGGGASRTVFVPAAGTATASYPVSCTTPNRPPSVNAGPDQSVLLGLFYSLSASFSDPDNDGPWSYTINWGDGSSSSGTRSTQGPFSAGHNYLLPGGYTIRVSVKDSHWATGSDTKVLTVLVKIGL